jgi:hypothetical protein
MSMLAQDDQDFKGYPLVDEGVNRGFENHGFDDDDNPDDDISVSESASSSAETNSGGSESSPSMRSFMEESSDVGVFSRIAGDGNEEDRRICGARCLFFFVLLIAAVSLGTMVFVITSRNAQNDFENQVRRDFRT